MPLTSLIDDLLGDLSRPGMPWQVGSIAASVVLGWLCAGLLQFWWRRRRTARGVTTRHEGMESLARVVAPLLVVGLLYLSSTLLAGHRFHTNIVKVAIPVFWSLVVIRLAFYLLRRVFARHGQLGEAFITFEKIFALVVWAAVALYITGMWPEIFDVLDATTIKYGTRRNDFVTLADVLQAIVSVAVLMMLALWAGAALEERLMGVQALHSSLRVALARVSRAVLIVGSVLISLSLVGIDLTVLSVFGGALGVGLGLGMQRIASNYVSGFIILIERSLSIGDMISVDKYTGKVTQINTRYTVLQGLDGVETVLPNEMLISGPVLNQTLSMRAVRASTKLMVAYGSDLEQVMPLLAAQAIGTPRVLENPAPGVSLSRFAPEGYELDLGFWIGDPENGQGGVVSEINKKIYALVQAGEIKLGIPALDTRLLDAHIASVVARIHN
ncbi:mechanosensitive ion channel protein [Massilia sp. WF1]|uniref:mechanosensitive ion channel family protein n=1 Tax=unclassified Massilia TaxID=2609279 RepID=UPI00064B2169|nr:MULTISPECIES: mechanosensitive ion channel domain-containing protein [unclassified Massilia]ALK98617.1 mechanosensitive ion channel protein [Massilia sp. WG5]KLU35012.1 mechanosensitive ion channel protein [Massilia sp. WF1]